MKEIDLTPGKELHPVSSVYFGGGTPSLLTMDELNLIMDKIRTSFPILPEAEITLEANPDDIDAKLAEQWLHTGINRLSIGIQSFYEEDLRWMNRSHSTVRALQSIRDIQNAGFSNYSIDLIYGSPVLTDEMWETNVNTAIGLKVPHLSCYALTVEPETALQKMIRLQKKEDVDPGKQAAQYLYLIDSLEKAGYEHYEISNFSRPGMYSHHNSGYWKGTPYFGFGPSAHSFDGKTRRWNIANNALYVKTLEQDIMPAESETLTSEQRFNEYIMTAIRTSSGIDLRKVENEFGQRKSLYIRQQMEKFISDGRILRTSGGYRLSREGKLFADGIAADLFLLEGKDISDQRLLD